jgi:hypothetical protein
LFGVTNPTLPKDGPSYQAMRQLFDATVSRLLNANAAVMMRVLATEGGDYKGPLSYLERENSTTVKTQIHKARAKLVVVFRSPSHFLTVADTNSPSP